MKIKTVILLVLVLISAGTSWSFCIIRYTGWLDGQTRCCDGLVRWWHPSTLPVPITINQTGSAQAPGDLTIDAVKRAMQTWTDVPSAYFSFSFAGTTAQNTSGNDEINIVVFDVRGENFTVGTTVLAFSRTLTRFDALGYRSFDSDMVFNARDYQWTVDGGQNAFDIETVALHEFGHHLGLDHCGGKRDISSANSGCGPVVRNAVMYYAVAPNSRKRVLQPDDVAGLTQIYPKWTIEGLVMDGTTGAAISHAPIYLHDTVTPKDTIAVSVVRSKFNGGYEAPVVDSLFAVSLSLFGYAPSETTLVHFTDQERIAVDFVMQPLPLSILQGAVRDRQTGGAVLAQVELFIGDELFRTTTTDTNGIYRFEDLPTTHPATTRYDRLRVLPQIPYPVTDIAQEIVIQSDRETTIDIEMETAEVLLVDDDGSSRYEFFYTDALSKIGRTYVHWDKKERGAADQVMPRFSDRTIVWFTGDRKEEILADLELDSLRSHLQRGGSLLLSGQNIAASLQERDHPFLAEILHVGWARNIQDPILHGLAGDPLGRTMPLLALTGGNSAWNQNSCDILLPDSIATVFVVYDTTRGDAAAVRVEQTISDVPDSRVVFYGFGLEGINDQVTGFAKKQEVLQNSIEWLHESSTGISDKPPAPAVPRRFTLYPAYPNPFNAEVVFRFSLAQNGDARTVLKIVDLLGREVRTLFDRAAAPGGDYRLAWDGRRTNGELVPSGIYFYRLQSGSQTASGKVVLVR